MAWGEIPVWGTTYPEQWASPAEDPPWSTYNGYNLLAAPVTQQNYVCIIEENTVNDNSVFVVAGTESYGVVAVVPEQNAATAKSYITIQSITQDYFQNNIKKFLPHEFWRMDALDQGEGGGDGALEDLVEVFALSMDEIKQAIDEFTLLFDIDNCPTKYLRTIAELLNYPLEDVDSTDEQRRQLKEAINWYKTKGARKGFEAMLYAFGFYASIIPLWTEYTEVSTIPGEYSETLSTAPDGLETSFSGQLTNPPTAGTVRLEATVDGYPEPIVDDGVGGLSGGTYSGTSITGTISYTTGNWSLTFSTAPTGSIVAKYYEYVQGNQYEIFTETVTGVAPGNDPPNDYPLLVENGGTWFRSPHFGIRLLGIVGDRHIDLDWDVLTEFELPISDEIVDSSADGTETSFEGDVNYTPIIESSLSGTVRIKGHPGALATFTDDGAGVLAGLSNIVDDVDATPNSVLSAFGSAVSGDTLATDIDPGSATFYTELVDGSWAQIVDDGVGGLADVANNVAGTINYTTGAWALTFSGSVPKGSATYPRTIVADYDVIVTGTIDYDTGDWTLEFPVAPVSTAEIFFDYTWDFEPQTITYGLHGAVYRYWDELHDAGVILQYHFDADEYAYLWRRLEFLRPVFAVLDWLELTFEMQEKYEVPDVDDPIMIVAPTREDKGWYYGYCDQDDAIYTRYDPRLLGDDLDIAEDALYGVAAPGVVPVTDELVYSVVGAVTTVNGTLANSWIFPGVEFTATVGATPIDINDDEGYLYSADYSIEGAIDYLSGAFQLNFTVAPDIGTSIVVDYNYVTDIPPVDRSGALPRGSTELPFPHVRDPQEGICHPPEELLVDWYWIQPEQYQLPLTRDGLVYLPAGPIPYIDHSDFPSRGFTDGGGDPGHANTLTRELGYAERPLSLLQVEQNPAASAAWEGQSTEWESWTGPWESI